MVRNIRHAGPRERRQTFSAFPQLSKGGFGDRNVLSRVHWVRPELVAEVKFLTWHAEAVVFDFVQPLVAVRRFRYELRQLRPYPFSDSQLSHRP
jgi:hypothetical protein